MSLQTVFKNVVFPMPLKPVTATFSPKTSRRSIGGSSAKSYPTERALVISTSRPVIGW